VQIPLQPNARTRVEAALAPSSRTRLVLSIEGISLDKTPDVNYEVYLDLPKNATPDYKSMYFVSNLSFFSLAHAHGGQAPTVSFDVTNKVRQLKASSAWNDQNVSVSFVARWLVDRNGHPLPIPPGVRARLGNVKLYAVTG
jgi:Protein of unknown function (DUF_B2219)